MRKAKITAANSGKAVIREWDLPETGPHQVLVQTEYSAISTGTETMTLREAADGTRLGYNSVGIVVEKGAGVKHVEVGQRVACYGQGAHADYMPISKFLVAPVPDHVAPEEAAFAGLGAIAIHALRQAGIQFGETAVVAGLGILGQIAAQVADAAAYRVVGLDPLPQRAELLKTVMPAAIACSRAEEVKAALAGGADSVLLFGGGNADGLLDRGISWLRDRGNIVIVGVPDTTFTRNALFAKEAQIRICRAGGPGRYDPRYEQEGFDYPIGYVRWTEGRNVGEFVRLLSESRLRLQPLIRHRFGFGDIAEAYQLCLEKPEQTMGIVIQY